MTYHIYDPDCFTLLPTAVAEENYRALLARIDERIDQQLITARQAEAARLLIRGLSRSEIALHMNIELNTLRAHIRGLYARLGVRTVGGRDSTVALIRVLLGYES